MPGTSYARGTAALMFVAAVSVCAAGGPGGGGVAEAGIARFQEGTREVRTSADIAFTLNDADADTLDGPGFFDGFSLSQLDEGVTAAIRQRSTVDDGGIALEGAFDFDVAPDLFFPLAQANSSLSAIYEVSGGDVLMSVDTAASPFRSENQPRFLLEDGVTGLTLLDVNGDQSFERRLTPGSYRILWEFAESTDVAGQDQDGGHSLDVAFADADGGGQPIPLPPAAGSALAALATLTLPAAAASLARRHRGRGRGR